MDVMLVVPMVDSMVWKLVALKAGLKVVVLAVLMDVTLVVVLDDLKVVN